MLVFQKFNLIMFYLAFFLIGTMTLVGSFIGLILALPFICVSLISQKILRYFNHDENLPIVEEGIHDVADRIFTGT